MGMEINGLDELMTDIAAMTAKLDMEKGGGSIANRKIFCACKNTGAYFARLARCVRQISNE